MHIELIDAIRCPAAHPFTWLVAQTAQISQRDVVTGMLGCPECGRRYMLMDGVLDLRAVDHEWTVDPAATIASEEDAVRLAALLGLGESGGIVVLAGTRAAAAPVLARLLEGGSQVLAVNPAVALTSGDGLSIVLTDGEVPLRDGTARGIAVDALHATPAHLDAAARTLADGGRLIAPSGAAVPADLHEIARDTTDWVGERAVVAGVVPLKRRGGEKGEDRA